MVEVVELPLRQLQELAKQSKKVKSPKNEGVRERGLPTVKPSEPPLKEMSFFRSVESDCCGAFAGSPAQIYFDVLDAAEDALCAELNAIRNVAAAKPPTEAKPASLHPPLPQPVPGALSLNSNTSRSGRGYSTASTSSSDRSSATSVTSSDASAASFPHDSDRGSPIQTVASTVNPSPDLSLGADGDASRASREVGSSGIAGAASVVASPPELDLGESGLLGDSESGDAADVSGGIPITSAAAAAALDTSEDAMAIAAAFDDPELSAEDRAAIAAVLLED
jgi:hypothetical protein